MADEGSTKKGLHHWTPDEDALLMSCLLELHEEGSLVADNGFKSGGFKKLERMMKEKAPGCGIMVVPHIQSRIKTLKQNWQIVYDMVHGNNTSGFGWDPEKLCVTAEKPVWDEYVKINKKAAQFWGKSFPQFDTLCIVFGKDRATGGEAISYCDVTDKVGDVPIVDVEAEVEDNNGNGDIGLEDNDPIFEETPITTTSIAASSGNRKRKRNSVGRDEVMIEAVEKMLTSASQGIKDVTQILASCVDKLARDSMLDAKREVLYEELQKLQELMDDERQDALLKIIKDDELLVVFPRLPDNVKLAVVRKLVA